MKYFCKFFFLLIAFIVGCQPLPQKTGRSLSNIIEIANTLFYHNIKEARSISIYYVIDDENKIGLRHLYQVAIVLDKILKDTNTVGYTPLFAYKNYRDAEIIAKDYGYWCWIKHNDKYKIKKLYYYNDDCHAVAMDIIIQLLSEET